MVYASVPSYPDASNWNQIQQQQQQPAVALQQQGLQAMGMGQASGISMFGGAAVQLPQPLSSIPPQPDSSMAGAARPTSMSERARMVKLPQTEVALKCPRCDSSNTKFCYFNNYSLSQPRHFCKTCRRYWTRGGALRNVPVGGGCRRNKRSKSSGSKALATADRPGPSTSISISASGGGVGAIIPSIQTSPQLPYMGSFLHGYSAPNLGMGYGVVQAVDQGKFQVGGSSGGNSGFEEWRLQHTQKFPFFAGLEQTSPVPTPSSLGLYELDSEGVGVGVGIATSFSGQVHGKPSASALITQLASVKMEESGKDRLSMPRQYLGMNPGCDEYWSSAAASGSGGNGGSGSAGWADLSSAFSSSSTGNLL